MADQNPMPARPSVSPKTIAACAMLLAIAAALAAWARFDDAARARDAEIARLRAEIQAMGERPAPAPSDPGRKVPAVPPAEGWTTLPGELRGRRFQIDVPVGFRLSVDEGNDEVAYVIAEPTPENDAPLPDLVIRLVDSKEATYAGLLDRPMPGRHVVTLKDGSGAFVFTGWEDMVWTESEAAVASFVTW